MTKKNLKTTTFGHYPLIEIGNFEQRKAVTMFGIYGRRMRRLNMEAKDTCGHDYYNYMNPNINYDKPPRKIRKHRKRIINRDCTCALDYDLTDQQLKNLRSQPHTKAECEMLKEHFEQLNQEVDSARRAEILGNISKLFSCITVDGNTLSPEAELYDDDDSTSLNRTPTPTKGRYVKYFL